MYLFYVDESGQREYNTKSSRHFVLAAAVGISDADGAGSSSAFTGEVESNH